MMARWHIEDLSLWQWRRPRTCELSPLWWSHIVKGASGRWVNGLWPWNLQLPGQCVLSWTPSSTVHNLPLSPINNDRTHIPEWTPLHTSWFVPKNSTAEAQLWDTTTHLLFMRVVPAFLPHGGQSVHFPRSEDLDSPLPNPTPASRGPSFQVYEAMGPFSLKPL